LEPPFFSGQNGDFTPDKKYTLTRPHCQGEKQADEGSTGENEIMKPGPVPAVSNQKEV
jgi:hypothetical protein